MEKKTLTCWIFGILLVLIVAVSWMARCQKEPEPEAMVVEFPLVRVPGALATYSGPVEFVVEPGQWLVVVLDPDGESVVLPTSGTWMAAAALSPGDVVTLARDGEVVSLVERE